jgi:class 3 adenylate cyclase
MYLGLHVGEVFFGNVGSRERLDFTVLGPAVNEASRIAAMCRSVDQPILLSAAFGISSHRKEAMFRFADICLIAPISPGEPIPPVCPTGFAETPI